MALDGHAAVDYVDAVPPRAELAPQVVERSSKVRKNQRFARRVIGQGAPQGFLEKVELRVLLPNGTSERVEVRSGRGVVALVLVKWIKLRTVHLEADRFRVPEVITKCFSQCHQAAGCLPLLHDRRKAREQPSPLDLIPRVSEDSVVEGALLR